MKYKKSFNKLGSVMPDVMASSLKGENKLLATLIINWPEIVGSEIANKTLPIKLTKKSNNEMVLHVEVDPAYVVEFEYQQLSTIEKISQYVGYNSIAAFKIIQKNFAAKNLEESHVARKAIDGKKYTTMIEDIDDENLRNALARMTNQDYNIT